MAQIVKRGSKHWLARVRTKGFLEQSRTFLTKADAERWAKEIEVAQQRGLFFDRSVSERTLINDLIAKYRAEVLPTKNGRGFEYALRRLSEFFGVYAVANVTSAQIADYRNMRLKTVSNATVRKEMSLLSRMLDLGAKEWGVIIPANPCKMVAMPAEAKGRDRRLMGDEEKRLLEACRASGSSPELEAIVITALETAARLGELLSLTWADVNFEHCTAYLAETKNGESRTLPLSTRAVSTLKALPRTLHKNRIFWRWSASNNIAKQWHKACKKAGIEGLHFHDLRHEAISRLFERGLNIMEVSTISGHKTLDMLKRYTHLKAETLVAKLG